MTIEITEADKERAAAFAGVWSMYGFAGYMELALIDAFAEHRIAALQAREDVISVAKTDVVMDKEVWRPIETAELWQVAIVTDGDSVAISQKAESDWGGHYWAVEPEDSLEWEPTHWIPLPSSTHNHPEATLQAREDVGESAEAVEQAAEMIWHRFAPPTQIEWQDEHEKAPHRDCARGVLSLYTHPTPAELPGDALREAAEEVTMRAFDQYRARNGRMCSIEGDDGEKCWVVPFDAMEDLRQALATKEKS